MGRRALVGALAGVLGICSRFARSLLVALATFLVLFLSLVVCAAHDALAHVLCVQRWKRVYV